MRRLRTSAFVLERATLAAQHMNPAYIPIWLNKPLPALDDETPVAALGQGRYKEVSKLVAELENDSFS